VAGKRNPDCHQWRGVLQTDEQAMSFGVAFRNALGLGLGGIVTLLTGTLGRGGAGGDLLTKSGDSLVQEDGGLILLE
jgi:hypothetical protein